MTCAKCGRQTNKTRLGMCLYPCYEQHRDQPRPLAASRPRKYKRRSDAKLTTSQIRAAYTLYRQLGTVNAVANLGWQQWGYSQPHKCATALGIAFHREGYSQLNGKPFLCNEICAGCGCPADERTFACKTCATRHDKRRLRGGVFVPARREAA